MGREVSASASQALDASKAALARRLYTDRESATTVAEPLGVSRATVFPGSDRQQPLVVISGPLESIERKRTVSTAVLIDQVNLGDDLVTASQSGQNALIMNNVGV